MKGNAQKTLKQRVDDGGEFVCVDIGLGRAGLVDEAEHRAPLPVEDIERRDAADAAERLGGRVGATQYV